MSPAEGSSQTPGRVSMVVQECHRLLGERVRPGDAVVDATCGNGNDTLFLARLVAPSGRVWAFDIQEAAMDATRTLLQGSGHLHLVSLIRAGHEEMGAHVRVPVRAVLFNLGYRPGGDKTCITVPRTTIAALDGARSILAGDGVIVAVVYPGHPGGAEEAAAVDAWFGRVAAEGWRVREWRQPDRATAAYLLCADDRG